MSEVDGEDFVPARVTVTTVVDISSFLCDGVSSRKAFRSTPKGRDVEGGERWFLSYSDGVRTYVTYEKLPRSPNPERKY